MRQPTIFPCWWCGSEPRVERSTPAPGVEWLRYTCCTAAQRTPHPQNAIDSWNMVQRGLELAADEMKRSEVTR